ncbi:hypothetical protein BASA81_009114 [Batrachochytrium salamandrivorans]|nr:hypothetical protein BASA81_009114 [Batrachochytrium salamandrivorans]
MWQQLAALRVANAVLVQTQFDPDEFWQAGEPAHLLVFGHGHLTWEWAPLIAIRGWLHPLLLAGPMYLLKATGMDLPLLVALFPRVVVQSSLLVWAEYCTWQTAKRLGGSEQGIVWLTTTNWFLFYCGIRTYSNSFEACVLAGVLYLWPEDAPPGLGALVLASASVAVRPTSLVSFAFLGAWYAWPRWRTLQFWELVGKRIIPTLLVCFLVSVWLDSMLYDRWVVVPFNFVRFNLWRNVAELYGTHAWYWYFVLCFPAILGVQLPAFCWGCWDVLVKLPKGGGGLERLLGLIVCNLAVLSLSPHKELRFALPCVLPALVLASVGMKHRPATTSGQRLLLLAGGGAIPALYLSLIHQRAAIDTSLFLSTLPATCRVDVLLGCHSIPHYAIVHQPLAALKFLDCSPKLPELAEYPQWNSPFRFPAHNESYLFQHFPQQFLQARYELLDELPNVIVTDSHHLAVVQERFSDLPVLRRFPHGQDGNTLVVLGTAC